MAAKGKGEGGRRSLNFNVGILGHIDSGKTSLAKALSSVASTASFDKNPQSRERGITLDLGFSSFSMPVPAHLEGGGYEDVQVTLVDCPGHASLIRTIIGGAQIIDFVILVVDITKGIQTQTAECLVIGEITCSHLMVVLNKTDLTEESKRDAHISKMTKRISKTLESTAFSGALVVPVAAKPGGPDAPPSQTAHGIDNLVQVLSSKVFVPERSASGPFVFSVDHCFPIRGQGTVMTGTVLSGSVALNDTIEIPFLKVTKKVKSMQMFHKPVQTAMQGDRVGICVTQFDPKQVERCLVAAPGYLPTLEAGIAQVHKVSYHKFPCTTGAKFHVTIGHETVMGKATFFSGPLPVNREFDLEAEYPFLEELPDSKTKVAEAKAGSDKEAAEGHGHRERETNSEPATQESHYALLEFEKPVTCLPDSIAIGSRLDTDVHIHRSHCCSYT
ncbi:Selenocysteine-specific elongation factor [Geodia barretti]|uniref:Selenocysteine-specific elongation factor n=2 Tax=Geodia barretti TaxID=519541 RepID=A0AA35TUM3_GEOBA|nr:Selenocysteine-specific elongation factor [Geodia barretti]